MTAANFCPQVNPSVLGGIVVDFGDKTIDLSVQSTVTKLNAVLQRKPHGPTVSTLAHEVF
jgi:hypothetical protein